MLVTYLRSSSLGTFEMCEQKYFFSYVLGVKDKENGKAIMGSVVHKNLELLARYKLALQAKKKTFVDDNFGKIKASQVSIEYFNELSHAYYEESFPGIMPKDSKDICYDWTIKALERLDGQMDPRNQHIFAVEEFFEVEVPHEWAKYSYELNGKKIEGQLGLKGTVDLVIVEDDVYLHVMDYKTGRRFNWATEEIKTYELLQEDKQLLLYYYALRLKYPEKKFYVSIYYINDHKIDGEMVEGGLFTFVFDDSDFIKAEQMIKKKFEAIRDNRKPRLLSPTCSNWKCKSLCRYSQILPEFSTEMPACLFIKQEIEQHGIEAVTSRYANAKALSTYTGGGRIDVELKE